MSWIDQLKQLPTTAAEFLPIRQRITVVILLLLSCILALCYWFWPLRAPNQLLNVAFDASRTYFAMLDRSWSDSQAPATDHASTLHAGSIQQTEALAGGLIADTVCLSSAWELDLLAERSQLVDPNWRTQFPDQASPFYSTIVFLVPSDNPRGIRDWPDLLRADVTIALPAPAISGAGRYAYLALIMHSLPSGESLFAHAPLRETLLRADYLPYGATRCTAIFSQRSRASVLLTWEAEALRAIRDDGAKRYRIVYPSSSLLAEPVVARLRPMTERRHSEAKAERYLNFLFSPEGQRLAMEAGFRPRMKFVAANQANDQADIKLKELTSYFDSWQSAHLEHFGPEGSYARILQLRAARQGGSE